jgi:predicted lipid-binding transport protein (Tim44 family)
MGGGDGRLCVTPSPSAPVVTNPSSSSSSGGGFTGTDAVVIALGAMIVLGGISFFIWRDARRRAPLRHRTAAATAGAGGRSRSGSKPTPKQRKLSPAERRRRKRGRAR